METEDYDDHDSETCYEPYPQTRGGKGRRNTRSSKKSGRLTPKDEGVSSGLDIRRQRAHIASLVNRPSVDNVAQIDTGRANRRLPGNKARAIVEDEGLLAQILYVLPVIFRTPRSRLPRWPVWDDPVLFLQEVGNAVKLFYLFVFLMLAVWWFVYTFPPSDLPGLHLREMVCMIPGIGVLVPLFNLDCVPGDFSIMNIPIGDLTPPQKALLQGDTWLDSLVEKEAAFERLLISSNYYFTLASELESRELTGWEKYAAESTAFGANLRDSSQVLHKFAANGERLLDFLKTQVLPLKEEVDNVRGEGWSILSQDPAGQVEVVAIYAAHLRQLSSWITSMLNDGAACMKPLIDLTQTERQVIDYITAELKVDVKKTPGNLMYYLNPGLPGAAPINAQVEWTAYIRGLHETALTDVGWLMLELGSYPTVLKFVRWQLIADLRKNYTRPGVRVVGEQYEGVVVEVEE